MNAPAGEESTQIPFAGASETHSAVVFFAGDRAYKLKKPVRLDFLDFGTVEARAAACTRETQLNRRFAPDVYLGVAEIRDPAGKACDHLVVMRRMPGSRRLSALIRGGEPATAAVRQVARMLAAQHASAERSPEISREGGRDALAKRWHDNFDQLTAISGNLIDATEIDEAAKMADRFLAGRAALFDARIKRDRIIDGHGDLLADDIFCLDDGPRILDCLDFDDHLRWVDGLDDAAFLAMDLEQLGAPQLAEQFMRWYGEFSGDDCPSSLCHHYIAYRAIVRAKVGCVRARQGDLAAAGETRKLMAGALRHLRAGLVTLVLVGGLPGTGKTSLAGKIAGQLGWVVVSSDRIRKELAGLEPDQPAPAEFGAGIYSQTWTDRTYAELLTRAAGLLSMGESVLVDATWSSPAHRQAAAAAAAQEQADLVQLECVTPEQVAASRLVSRAADASDATAATAAGLAAEWAPWPEATVIDTSPPAGPVDQALNVVRPHGPEHVWRPLRPYMLPG
jgi:uncharacterized protein